MKKQDVSKEELREMNTLNVEGRCANFDTSTSRDSFVDMKEEL